MTQNQHHGAYVIDIDGSGSFMERKIYKKGSRWDRIHNIYSKNNRDKDNKDYEPSHLSIGPYYHGSPALHAMEKVKWVYLGYFLELNNENNLHDYIEAIKGLEKQARTFYGDEIKMDRKSFVEMLLLDACFILMTLNGTDEFAPGLKTLVEESEFTMNEQNKDQLIIDMDDKKQIIEKNDVLVYGDEDNSYVIRDQLRTKYVLLDMLLLENQIPFFIITKLYEIVTGGRSSISLLVNNIVQSMKDMFSCHPEEIQNSNPATQIYHLLHLCHRYFKPCRRDDEKYQNCAAMSPPFENFLHLGSKVFELNKKSWGGNEYESLIVRRVTQYHEVRIKLNKKEFAHDAPYSVLDIRFVNGELEIPCLNIDPETFILF